MTAGPASEVNPNNRSRVTLTSIGFDAVRNITVFTYQITYIACYTGDSYCSGPTQPPLVDVVLGFCPRPIGWTSSYQAAYTDKDEPTGLKGFRYGCQSGCENHDRTIRLSFQGNYTVQNGNIKPLYYAFQTSSGCFYSTVHGPADKADCKSSKCPCLCN